MRREIAATLPKGLGDAVERLGTLRRRLRAEDEQDELQRQRQRRQLQLQSDQATSLSSSQPCNVDNVNESTESPPETDGPLVEEDDGEADDSLDQGATFNRLVDERAQGRPDEQRGRRGRWLAQMCEYWPLRRLVALTDGDVEELVRTYRVPSSPPASSSAAASGPAAEQDAQLSAAPILAAVRPNILILAGAGPGDPSLVTHATYAALQRADLVLADKLVPSAVLDLVPRRTEVRIARKFPGNADAAQDELMELARQVFARDGDGSCRGGKVVVRLKQGDPFVFGRGGEEVIEFEAGGDDSGDGSNRSKVPVRVVILPGLSSALVAPLLARIPCTMRGVADQVLVCTGTGRKGRPPEPPGYAPGRTAVFLMALHRVAALVVELTSFTQSELDGEDKENEEDVKGKVGGDAAVRLVHRRRLWPRTTPCAVIERASCSDQRIIRTTLDRVAAAVEAEGSRPPGLLVVGRACEALWSPSRKNMDVNGDDRGRGWTVEEGFEGFAGLDDGFADGILGWRRSDDTRGEGDAAS